jgi:hypothetical protein
MKPYRKRLNIAVDAGSETLFLFSQSGLHLATGYTRVVIGKRGPYIEFRPNQIVWTNFHVPESQIYRFRDARVFYIEHRSNCNSNVMLYQQRRTVAYADYKIGFCYISPFDLIMTGTCPVISP